MEPLMCICTLTTLTYVTWTLPVMYEVGGTIPILQARKQVEKLSKSSSVRGTGRSSTHPEVWHETLPKGTQNKLSISFTL